MSWNEVKKSSGQKKAAHAHKQKQNIIDNEDLGKLNNDSIFSALSNIDNKEQKKIEENANKEMKQNTSNSSLPSPKTPKKIQDTPTKTAPIEELSKLNVTDFISKNIKINDNEQDQVDQLKKLCNYIETEITNKLFCCTTKFSHKSFDIDSANFKGPISYLAPKQRKEIENVFSKCKESVIKKLFVLITKCIFVGEKKAVNVQTISNTIAHQLCVQIISNLYPGIFYKKSKEGKKVYEQTVSHHKNIIEKLPAIGNTLIWVCMQQHYNVNKKEICCPEYVELWMEYFLNALTSNDASIAIQTQSVKLLNKVLDSIKENKNKLETNIKIPVESFIALIAILNTGNVVSQIKKHDKLYDGVTKAYESLKSILFDNSSKVLQFNVKNMDMFVKLYKLLSDPTYDRAVYNEFLNIIVLTFAKDQSLFDSWGTIYKQYQPNNLPPSSAIVEEIKRQQTEYFKSKKYCPSSNCWEELDNNRLRNTFYEMIGVNEQHRTKNNENEINKMNKNIRAILDKTSSGKSNGGFFRGFLMRLIKRSIILVILLSLSLHVFDSVDEYNSKNSKGGFKLPVGHPKITGNETSKCPYQAFRNKYTKCNQCHPVIKYVYDYMEEPYKYIESRAVIPVYKNVWKPYCSKSFMMSLEKGIIPTYRFVKPIVTEKVVQPVQENVVPRAVELYDTYAREYVERANKDVFKPALATSSKYVKQAYIVAKPYSIKAKDFVINDVVKPSIPYINKAKIRGIQYGNQFLDTLAEIPYKRIMKNGASNSLRFVGYAENKIEEFYVASTPYVKKYWDVLSRKTNVLMQQENVQKVITNQYVKTTTDAIKDAYHIWCDGVKVSYVYLTNRGPETGGAKNWKDATSKVSIKKDIRSSIDFTKSFFKNVIEKLEKEDKHSFGSHEKRSGSKIVNAKNQSKDSSLPTKKGPKVAPEMQKPSNGYKIVVNNENAKKITKERVNQANNINMNDTKNIAKEKAKIKQEVKRVVKEEYKNNISKQIAKEKTEAAKNIAMSKQIIKEEVETTKQVAMDNAINSEAKQAVEDNVENTEVVMESTSSSDDNQVVNDNVESTKQVAMTKAVVKEEHETTKQVAMTKAIVKEDHEATKQLAMENASSSSDDNQVVNDNVESTKQVAMTKAVVKEEHETTKQVAMTKAIVKEEHETTKQVAMTKQIVKEEYETTKQVAMDNATN
ncbi:hypothetical protein BCR36DRAFT_588137 [Piromyces finnis]|uniref:Uncharacterized protein n=1 Tax=Piromyces finnis TaxID=1754191 RepID=A0A1Y1UR61_9FUNG|nr:hypothetical protein BCR36DRAFT_588137 [Piromyces finnis]|eukprot:ORX40432.1 hypothetical protein BCR36DRAFT_588137 [Piromyces finnis]